MFSFNFFKNRNEEQQLLNEIRPETEKEVWEKRAECLDKAAATAVVGGLVCVAGGTVATVFTKGAYALYTCGTTIFGCGTTSFGGPTLNYLSNKAKEKANDTPPQQMKMRRYC